MILREEKRDLFSVSDDYYFAHCISADFGMGKGIVVEFNKRFDMKNKIKKIYPDGFINPIDDCYESIGCILIDNVFNLITKDRYWNKPTYRTLEGALCFMKEECLTRGINKIAMPKIGCGLDRLQWDKVRELISEIFADTDIEILVCSL